MVKPLNKKYNIYLLAIAASMVLALLTILQKQSFDPDGLIYFKAAEVFLASGLKASLKVYPWPLYSILIAIVSQISHLTLYHAALFLNALLDATTVCVFMALIATLGGSRKLQLLGAFLLLALPYFNHFRFHILRGHGYYPFALLGILLLMRYADTQKWRYAISWSITILIATLFRVEGLILLCCLPLGLILQKPHPIRKIIKAYTIQIIAMLSLIIVIVFTPHSTAISTYFGRITSLVHHTAQGFISISHFIANKNALITHHILGVSNPIKSESTYFIIGGLLAVLIGVTLRTFGLLYPGLTIYTLKQKLIPNLKSLHILIFAIILNIVINLIFLLQHFFLSNRYIALLMLLMLLTVPFAVAKIYTNWKQNAPKPTGNRWLFWIIATWIIYTAIGGVGHFGPSETYLIKAAKWLKNNTPKTTRLCTNHFQILYIADRKGTKIKNLTTFLQNPSKLHCDYVALNIKHTLPNNLKQRVEKIRLKKEVAFQNRRKDKMYIFK